MRLRVLGLAAAILLAAVSSAAAERRVFVTCAVAQGNGFNWAATLGWLAAEAELAAARAAAWAAAAPDREAALDLACFTGSSSGSFAGATLAALLANPRLVSGAAGPGLLTPAEGAGLADALLFLALVRRFSRRGGGLPPFADRRGGGTSRTG
jgi:hypothetical protein